MKNFKTTAFCAIFTGLAIVSCKKTEVKTDDKKVITVAEDTIYSKTLPKHTQIRITPTSHFIDDWQGETAYLRVTPKNGKATELKMERVGNTSSFRLPYANDKNAGTILRYDWVNEKSETIFSERFYIPKEGKLVVQDPTISSAKMIEKWDHKNGLSIASYVSVEWNKDSMQEVERIVLDVDSIKVLVPVKGGFETVNKKVFAFSFDNPTFVGSAGASTNVTQGLKKLLSDEDLAKDQIITANLLVYLKDQKDPHGKPYSIKISL